jgi:hypothetical protein
MVIRGLERALDILRFSANEIPKKLKDQRRQSARAILNEAKKNAPKLTGKLRNSGIVEEPNEATSRITFNADYAPYMEFGTGGLVDVPPGWEELAIQFKGKGKKKINLKAQPYLIPAFIKESINFKDQCQKIVQQVQR